MIAFRPEFRVFDISRSGRGELLQIENQARGAGAFEGLDSADA